MNTHVSAARDVLSVEIAGLEALKQALGDGSPLAAAFDEAVAAISVIKGRVIVSGMGKSGHIGRKIAATLASTGVPASYVHPGEASHGDLGMISRKDLVLALSNSGETPELGDLLGYCRRFSIPLISITSGVQSELDKSSTISLLLPKAEEACGVTKAPTTSTTMALAMGDALAVALLRDKGFSSSDFKNFHPGGKLGAGLKKVRDIMHAHQELPLCAPDLLVSEAVREITEKGFGCIGVINADGTLAGMVTDGDLRRNFSDGLVGKTVGEIMTRSPQTVTPDTLAAEALGLLSGKRITALFVVEGGKPAGLLHVHDCLSTGVI